MFKLDLENSEESKIKLPTSVGSSKKQESSRKTSFLLYWLCQSFWLCGSQQPEDILKDMGIRDYQMCLLTNLYAGQEATVRIGHGTKTGSKLGKEYVKTVYCHPAYLTYMQSTSWNLLDWMKHKLELRLLAEISVTQNCRWHHPYGRKQRSTKEPLDESERGEWKSWLKTQYSEN